MDCKLFNACKITNKFSGTWKIKASHSKTHCQTFLWQMDRYILQKKCILSLILSLFKMHWQKWIIFFHTDRWQRSYCRGSSPCRVYARYQPKSGHGFLFIMHYRVSFSLRLITVFNYSKQQSLQIYWEFFKISEIGVVTKVSQPCLFTFVTKQVMWQGRLHITAWHHFENIIMLFYCQRQ